MRTLSILAVTAGIVAACAQDKGPLGKTYDGVYALTYTSSDSACDGTASAVTIRTGRIDGTILVSGEPYQISGTVNQAGEMTFDAVGAAVFEGAFTGPNGSGRWTAGRCRGTFQLTTN